VDILDLRLGPPRLAFGTPRGSRDPRLRTTVLIAMTDVQLSSTSVTGITISSIWRRCMFLIYCCVSAGYSFSSIWQWKKEVVLWLANPCQLLWERLAYTSLVDQMCYSLTLVSPSQRVDQNRLKHSSSRAYVMACCDPWSCSMVCLSVGMWCRSQDGLKMHRCLGLGYLRPCPRRYFRPNYASYINKMSQISSRYLSSVNPSKLMRYLLTVIIIINGRENKFTSAVIIMCWPVLTSHDLRTSHLGLISKFQRLVTASSRLLRPTSRSQEVKVSSQSRALTSRVHLCLSVCKCLCHLD